jgi:hypothetical protein
MEFKMLAEDQVPCEDAAGMCIKSQVESPSMNAFHIPSKRACQPFFQGN